MSRFLSLRSFLLGATALCALPAAVPAAEPSAAPGGDEADVVSVRFERPRGPGGTWWVMEVEIGLRAGTESSRRFIDRPGVVVELGCEVAQGGTRAFEFYQAEATAVTVAQGGATFRFYLPPEIVARDRMTSDARFFVVELSIQGRVLPLRRENVSANLAQADTLARFRARVAAEAPRNQGVLLAQPFTPFASSRGGPPGPTLLPRF